MSEDPSIPPLPPCPQPAKDESQSADEMQSLLVLPDDALKLILCHLARPSLRASEVVPNFMCERPTVYAVRCPFHLVGDCCREAGNCSEHSDAESLAATCRRLRSLFQSEVVRCLDLLEDPPCWDDPGRHTDSISAGVALSLLRRFPALDCVVADAEIIERLLDVDAQVFSRITAICLVSLPGPRCVEMFSAGLPCLTDLIVRTHKPPELESRLHRCHVRPQDLVPHEGMQALIGFLPTRLRRLRLFYVGTDAPANERLWQSVHQLSALEDLELAVHSMPAAACKALKLCTRLRRLHLRCRDWQDASLNRNNHAQALHFQNFVASIPASVEDLMLCDEALSLSCPLGSESFARLKHLKRLGLKRITVVDWNVFLPVASRLTHFSLIVGFACPSTLRVLATMTSLKELALVYVDGIDARILRSVLRALRCLRELEVSYCMSLSDPGLAEALRAASFARSISHLSFRDCEHVGDETAAAIATCFPAVSVVTMLNTGISNKAGRALLRSCPKLIRTFTEHAHLIENPQ